MKKNNSGKRGPLDSGPQNSPPDKVGWIRKFCRKGIFREIWKNRFVVLRGDQLFICEKEVKDLGRADEVLDLSDYERCEEIRKNKSRSKKNHSKFRLQRCSSPGNTVPNLVFLAVSPEEKESWINNLNAAITRAKNRILDEVTAEDSQLSHLTRDRAKIPQNRRLPTRGHLLAVASASSSDGMLILDLIQEDDRPDSRTAKASGKSHSLPLEAVEWEKTGPAHTDSAHVCPAHADSVSISPAHTNPAHAGPAHTDSVSISPAHTPQPARRRPAEWSRCVSMEELRSRSGCSGAPGGPERLMELIGWKLEETERLLTEARGEGPTDGGGRAERLLQEAAAAWKQAREVLQEVKELRALFQKLDPPSPAQM